MEAFQTVAFIRNTDIFSNIAKQQYSGNSIDKKQLLLDCCNFLLKFTHQAPAHTPQPTHALKRRQVLPPAMNAAVAA